LIDQNLAFILQLELKIDLDVLKNSGNNAESHYLTISPIRPYQSNRRNSSFDEGDLMERPRGDRRSIEVRPSRFSTTGVAEIEANPIPSSLLMAREPMERAMGPSLKPKQVDSNSPYQRKMVTPSMLMKTLQPMVSVHAQLAMHSSTSEDPISK